MEELCRNCSGKRRRERQDGIDSLVLHPAPDRDVEQCGQPSNQDRQGDGVGEREHCLPERESD